MRKMKKFADGGRAARGQSRYDRMVKDIESDFEKAKGRKSGRALEVARAKYEQRMADAKDDLAKARGEDRSATRAAEKAAESNLTMTRRYGASTSSAKVRDAEPIAKTMSPSEIASKVSAPDTSPARSAPARSAPARSAPARSAPARSAPARSTERRAAPATVPENKDRNDIVVTGRRSGDTTKRTYTSAESRERAGRMLGNVGRGLANVATYLNPATLVGRAIFDSEPAKPKAATPAQRTPAQQARKDDYLRRAASERAAGREGNAKFYEREAGYLKKGGTVKKYAKGGKIDGCAVRGKTRAK